ncbi:hypothetical protein NECAME_15735, partial [Necator americanus]
VAQISEPVSFWNKVHKSGLLDELVDQLTQCLSDIKRAAKSGGLTWAAPLLTRVVSVLNMSDQIVSCVHSKPSAQFSTDVVVIPRVSADYVSVENNTQKRMIREELVSSQVYCPDVKRPRFRNHASFISCSEVRIYRCQDADVKEVEPRIVNDFITKTCLSEISIKAKSFEKKNVSVLVYSNPSTAYTE